MPGAAMGVYCRNPILILALVLTPSTATTLLQTIPLPTAPIAKYRCNGIGKRNGSWAIVGLTAIWIGPIGAIVRNPGLPNVLIARNIMPVA